jgi:hypothetical protein
MQEHSLQYLYTVFIYTVYFYFWFINYYYSSSIISILCRSVGIVKNGFSLHLWMKESKRDLLLYRVLLQSGTFSEASIIRFALPYHRTRTLCFLFFELWLRCWVTFHNDSFFIFATIWSKKIMLETEIFLCWFCIGRQVLRLLCLLFYELMFVMLILN